jgi:hypothetical protein
MFSWHGNADLIVAIIKLFEDLKNADDDILGVGVQAILLVEDSVRYYSTYLPELYKLILAQTREFMAETINEQQRKIRKRSRPKILLATNLDDAMTMYEKYKSNLLGVISDVGFTVHKGEGPEMEKLDAGIDLVKHIKADDPMMPVLLQSSQDSISEEAERLEVGFLRKYSKTLMLQLSDYIKEEFIMRLSSRIISIILALLTAGSTFIGCAETEVETEAETLVQDAQTRLKNRNARCLILK